MPWPIPVYVPGVVWKDETDPLPSTKLDAQNLNLQGNSGAAYSAQVGQSVVDYLETIAVVNGQPAPGAGATGDLFMVRSDGTIARFTPPDVYASAWGMSSSGTATANTTALQNAITAAVARKATLVISDGTFSYNGVQIRDQQGLNIRGAGMQSTILSVVANNTVGLDVYGSAGTGDCADVHISDLQVAYSATGVTAARFWNCQPFSMRRCMLKADLCGLSIQGSYVGSVKNSRIYLQGSNTNARAAVWLGSGKSVPHLTDTSVTANISNLSTNVTNISPALTVGYTYTVQGAGIPGGTSIPGTKITITGTGTTGTLSAPAIATTVGVALTLKAITLSGNGTISFDTGVIESANGPAIIIEDNSSGLQFQVIEMNAKLGASGAFNGMVEMDSTSANDSIGAAATFDRCYQEGSDFGGADFALGTYEGHCNRVTIRGYESTGSSGMAYAIDVAACDHLIVQQLQTGNYTSGVIRFRAGYLTSLIGATKSQLRCEQIDNGGATGTPIYVDADGHISSTYRGPIVRTNTWHPISQRNGRLDAAVATSGNTYQLGNGNPTAVGGSDPNGGTAWTYLDPANWGYGPLRVIASVLVNNVAPGTTINVGLVPQSGTPTGGAGAVTQGNGAFVMASASVGTPAANSSPAAVVSAAGYIMSPGWYALAVSTGGAFAASSSVSVMARLEAMN